tara:strand:+ start:225 stop:449 length:225 start_codon:yes stop_codon:yes gene_type:complete
LWELVLLREITCAIYTDITCPETKEIIDTIQAILAFIMAILGLKSAVPNKFHPTPSGSDMSGMICCPVIKKKER